MLTVTVKKRLIINIELQQCKGCVHINILQLLVSGVEKCVPNVTSHLIDFLKHFLYDCGKTVKL